MQRIITTALFSGVLIAVAPAVVLGEAIPKKGATSYVTHFVFHPLSSIDVPGVGKAITLEAVGPTVEIRVTTWTAGSTDSALDCSTGWIE